MKIFAVAFMALLSLCSVSDAALVGMNGVFTSGSGGVFGNASVGAPVRFSLFVTSNGISNVVTSWTLKAEGLSAINGVGGAISLNAATDLATIALGGVAGTGSGTVALPGAPFTGDAGDFSQANLNKISGVAGFTFTDATFNVYSGSVNVPEPASMFAFAAASGIGAVVYRRRRKKSPVAA